MSDAGERVGQISGSRDGKPQAALKGASRAFGKPPIVAPKPDLAAVKLPRNNGALIAATRSWATSTSAANNLKNIQTRSLTHLVPEATQSTPTIAPELEVIRNTHLRSASLPRQVSGSLPSSQQPEGSNEGPVSVKSREPPRIPAARRSGGPSQRTDSMQADYQDLTRVKPQSKQSSESDDLLLTSSTSLSPITTELYSDVKARPIPRKIADQSRLNAMVGAHVAVSRSPPKHKSPLPSPPRHRSVLQNAEHPGSRGASPRKAPAPMRHTMRSSESSSSEESSHHYHRPKRHPHKHHEGERKKWRDRLTDEELKRYAGWWAANRGWHVPKTCPFSESNSKSQAEIKASYKPDEEVANVVVRDLWRRSRLSNHTLIEIWQLVDDRKIGSLSKDQFIVGVWLIDQKLKGHKLPTHISQSVWQSVANMNAVAVKIRVP